MSDEDKKLIEYDWRYMRDNLEKRIEELEKSNIELRGTTHSWMLDAKREIAELKEGCKLLNDQKNTNKEVLRELNRCLWRGGIITIEHRDKILEKLDSQGKTEAIGKQYPGLGAYLERMQNLPKETEKKEVCEHLNIIPRGDLSYVCKDCGYDTFIEKRNKDGNLTHLIKKDSGGEKLVGSNTARQNSRIAVRETPYKTNSKPPEPVNDHYCIFKKNKCYICGKDEPREDDKINTLHKIKMIIKLDYPELRVVKREDLQWVYEQAKLGIYEDCKDDGGFLDEDLYQRIINKLNRIKEEYGIE